MYTVNMYRMCKSHENVSKVCIKMYSNECLKTHRNVRIKMYAKRNENVRIKVCITMYSKV